VWHHAHEWVRAHLQEILDVYATRDKIYLDKYLGGLPPCCFDDPEHVVVAEAGWTQRFPPVPNPDAPKRKKQPPWLGDMIHAFPRYSFTRPSWARTLTEPQYVTLMSDGDLGMLPGMRRGMGNGLMAINRSGIDTWVNLCGYHLPVNLKRVSEKFLANALHDRRNGVLAFMVPAASVLDGPHSYFGLFGQLLDECMQTDCKAWGLLAWSLFRRKAELMGMTEYSEHAERYHHPMTGRQGTWARWNMLQEPALRAAFTAALVIVGTENVSKGGASTANGIEGRMNKWLSTGTRTSLPYGPLTTKGAFIMSNLNKELTGIRFSVVPDQQGECARTFHRKQSGAPGVQKTGNVLHLTNVIPLVVYVLVHC
jgi:hypothetical protein